ARRARWLPGFAGPVPPPLWMSVGGIHLSAGRILQRARIVKETGTAGACSGTTDASNMRSSRPPRRPPRRLPPLPSLAVWQPQAAPAGQAHSGLVRKVVDVRDLSDHDIAEAAVLKPLHPSDNHFHDHMLRLGVEAELAHRSSELDVAQRLEEGRLVLDRPTRGIERLGDDADREVALVLELPRQMPVALPELLDERL